MTSISTAILSITLVAFTGLLAGAIRIRGVGLGSAGVLFAGILFGHFGANIDHDIATFAKEFGLILFVFSIGLQLGPGIVALWRKRGLALNAMAAAIVLQGAALAAGFLALLDLPPFTGVGLFCGATTNTPSLGAAEQVGGLLGGGAAAAAGIGTLASAYAVAYPGGIIGIIGSMILIRRLFKIDVAEETQRLDEAERSDHEPVERRSVLIENDNLGAIPYSQIPGIEETGVRISRIRRCGDESIQPANNESVLRRGDTVQVVGPVSGLDRFIPLLGRPSDADLMQASGDVGYRRVFVTEPRALHQSLRELSLDTFFNATVTRIVRSGIEMTARGSSRFHYGDIAHIVGDRSSLDRATEFLGNSSKSLNETKFAPLFAAIAVGVVAGMIPIHFPGVPFPVKLGLAGGPLLAAIAFSLIGNIGKFVWYVPPSANNALRDLGIILFLACAGLGAGEAFFASAMSLQGLLWMAAGAAINNDPAARHQRLRRRWRSTIVIAAGSLQHTGPARPPSPTRLNLEASSTAYAAVLSAHHGAPHVAAQALVFLFV
ncbi:MAG: hypothetical protein R3F11_03460 [Verrucomicrobiales bacterium]